MQSNNVLAFADEHCVVEAGAESYRQEMYALYKEFCKESGLGRALSEGKFNDNICKVDPAVVEMARENITRRRIFRGIRAVD